MVNIKGVFWILVVYCLFSINFFLFSQDTGQNQDEPAADAEEIPVPEVKIAPKFPVKNTKLLFIEGEDAISTNFNKEPILNYGCSGKRTLQLNRSKGLQGGAPFYADFVFYVEEPGTYEFWYGGTPSGPADELYPSFVSPFKYVIDNSEEKRSAYREDITVVENYTPSYYWNMVTQLDFDQGKHQIRFEVSEKRGHDSRFYFYLDCFFFVKIEDDKRVPGAILPPLFPEDMDNRTINYPFRSLDDYLIVIRDNPGLAQPYVDISLIYSLLGDYLNALKYLKRAIILDAKNPENMLLLAKNYIWKGDITQGLSYYSQLLAEDPAKKDIWMEAGKVAGWSGRYDSSVSFFQKGLSHFPDDLDLTVNLGITYLWMGKKTEADAEFKKAFAAAGSDAKLLKELAQVFEVNLYPEQAADVYLTGIKQVPDDIEMYLLLENLYFNNGQKDKAQKVRDRIVRTFQPSGELDKYLDVFYERMGLKEKVIADYRQKLEADPDNLELREMLAQAYFWNGLKKEAIDEYLNILSNHAYRKIMEMEKDAVPLLMLVDKFHIYGNYFSGINTTLNNKQREINLQASRYFKAQKIYDAETAKAAKARESGKELPVPEVDPLIVLNEEGDKLASLIADAEELVQQYSDLFTAFITDSSAVTAIEAEDNKNEEVFAKITEPIKWKWDSNLFISEQQQIAGRGLTLANHVLAKIYQYTGRYADALANYNKIREKLDNPELEYGYFQTLLWSGSTGDAFEFYAEPGTQISVYAPYTEEVQQLAESCNTQIEGSIGVLGDNPQEESKAAMTKLADTGKKAVSLRKDVQVALNTLDTLLNHTLVRAFYDYQESTYLLRNELGDSLLIAERLSEAITQYKQVLAIDPWDITAIYRLGTVYQWNRDWYKAMDFFRRVYYADPNYENATALYNQLAREHADTISFKAGYNADGSSITWEGAAEYAAALNGFLGFKFTYLTDYTNIYRWPLTITNAMRWDIYNFPVNNYAYQVHDLAFSLPLGITPANFYFTPSAGAALTLTDSFLAAEAAGFSDLGDATVTPAAFFGFNQLYPYVKFDIQAGEHPYFLLSGMGRYGTYEPTYGFARTKSYAFSGNLNLLTDFIYTDVPFIKNFALRVYGEMDYISDLDLLENKIIYAATGELTFNIFKLPSPAVNLNLFGNGTYQDSDIDNTEATNNAISYYAPHQTLVAGGGLSGSAYLNLNDNRAMSISLLGGCDYNSSYDVWKNAVMERVKIMASGNLEFIRGNGSVSFGVLFQNQYNLITELWDSWNLSVNIGYSADMPALLAQ